VNTVSASLHTTYSSQVTKGQGIVAKASGLQGQGHDSLSSSCSRGQGHSWRTPLLWNLCV